MTFLHSFRWEPGVETNIHFSNRFVNDWTENEAAESWNLLFSFDDSTCWDLKINRTVDSQNVVGRRSSSVIYIPALRMCQFWTAIRCILTFRLPLLPSAVSCQLIEFDKNFRGTPFTTCQVLPQHRFPFIYFCFISDSFIQISFTVKDTKQWKLLFYARHLAFFSTLHRIDPSSPCPRILSYCLIALCLWNSDLREQVWIHLVADLFPRAEWLYIWSHPNNFYVNRNGSGKSLSEFVK